MASPPTSPPPGRFRHGQAVWLTRTAEDGSDLHYPCHVLGFNRLTGLYSVARADDRNRHAFAAAETLTPRREGEIAPGLRPRSHLEAVAVQARR